MPIYDYHCDHCEHSFSAVRSYTDEAPVACPSCGKVPRKLLTNPAIVFKGGGWYKTDSRPKEKEGGGPAAPKEGAKDGAAVGAKDAPGAKDGKDAKPAETVTSAPAKTESVAPKSEAPSS